MEVPGCCAYGRGLYGARSVNVSVDGKSVYVVSLAGAVAVLDREPPPPVASFLGSPTILRVGPSGRLRYRFLATPLSSGNIKLASTKSVRDGLLTKRKLTLGPRPFAAPVMPG